LKRRQFVKIHCVRMIARARVYIYKHFSSIWCSPQYSLVSRLENLNNQINRILETDSEVMILEQSANCFECKSGCWVSNMQKLESILKPKKTNKFWFSNILKLKSQLSLSIQRSANVKWHLKKINILTFTTNSWFWVDVVLIEKGRWLILAQNGFLKILFVRCCCGQAGNV
jgi:hypothetical protein